MSQTIEIFDVRENLPNNFLSLKYLPFYKTGKWNKLWNFINDVKIDNPQTIIIQNINELRNRNPKLSEKIEDLVILYNHKNKGNFSIIYDYFDELKTDSISDLFNDRPGQYGFRGDIELWEDLIEYFKNTKLPKTELELEQLIHDAIKKLTGTPIEEHDYNSIFVEKYNKGGMSGGVVSTKFWLYKGIPILIGRYKRITMYNNVYN